MVTIIFESHSTTIDNEAHRSSGWNDVELSELGLKQSKELGERYAEKHLDAIFCSDLQRSYKTGEIAFANRGFPIIQDERLRECNYGDLTQHASSEVDPEKPKHIIEPFPNGESYEQTAERMKYFLTDLLCDYEGKTVMVIGHRATQYGLEHWIKGVSIADAVSAPWKWQPGWVYELKEIEQCMDLITRFEKGNVAGFGLPDRVIDVQISKIFFFGNRVVKVYKREKQFFADLADIGVRKEFYAEDFYWNHAMSPEIYMRCVSVVDGDDEDFYIEMQRIDGEQTLTKKLIDGAVTEDVIQKIVESLVQSLRRITVEHHEKLQPLFSRGLLSVHVESLEDLRDFAYLADDHIPRPDADTVVDMLIEQSTQDEYFSHEHEHIISAAIDNNPDNVLIIDDDVRFIDVMPPKESWRVADEYLTIVRSAVDAYALGSSKLGDAVYAEYRQYQKPIPERVTRIYEIRAALIQRVYRHILGQHDVAERYQVFGDERIEMLRNALK